MAKSESVHLELSRVPALNLTGRLDWLVAYPHGCVEQTTSKAFPQLYLSKLLELDEGNQGRIDQTGS